ncbi:MAG: hypothetical protein HZA17_11375 [Nitrospirae bacterium]|nr:hypothetical protein [Nitrospirota bacterium]
MAGNRELTDKICRDFCSYYKPGKNEELACQGFFVIKQLAEKGRVVPSLRDSRREMPGDPAQAILSQFLCSACPFSDSDCDFMLGTDTASPCGGYLFAARLMEAGLLTVDDLKGIH